jgi:hypothetical protein
MRLFGSLPALSLDTSSKTPKFPSPTIAFSERIQSMMRLVADVVPPGSDVALAAGSGRTDHIGGGRVSDLGRRNLAAFRSGFGGRHRRGLGRKTSSYCGAAVGVEGSGGRELAARVCSDFESSGAKQALRHRRPL